MRSRLVVVGLVLGLCFASPAAASPVQYLFNGSVAGCIGFNDPNNGFLVVPGPPCNPGSAAMLALYPIGTPVSFLLNFDTVGMNRSKFPATSGFYSFPGGQVTIAGQTYLTEEWAFEINCPIGFCLGGGPGVEQEFNPLSAEFIRIVNFTGPGHGATIVFGSHYLNYSCVVCAPDGLRLAGQATVTALPEPGTWLLLGTGMAVVGAIRRRRRR